MRTDLKHLLGLGRAEFAERFVLAELLDRCPGARWAERVTSAGRRPKPSPPEAPAGAAPQKRVPRG